MLIVPAIEGFLLGGGLIIAIGAQNAFILKQGLKRQHVFILCLVASLADALLIVLGVVGMGALINANPELLFYITLAGAIFLAIYAVMAAIRAFTSNGLIAADRATGELGQAISILLAFTLLNPHVYLDTVVLLGGIAGQYSGSMRVAFATGAVLSSFAWFFSLGYGAQRLAPLFKNPSAWRMLDGLIAVIMATLSISLFIRAFRW
ncbi:MAG: LysE/ArgO family amino acid transporter [Rhizobiaceae bacterium]